MRESQKNLVVATCHTCLDPEAWLLVYFDDGVNLFTNLDTTKPENTTLAIDMLHAMIDSLKDETKSPGTLTRLKPSNN